MALALILLVIPAGSAAAGTGSPDHTTYDYRSTAGWPEAPEISAGSACMIELNTGAVLYDKNGDAKSYPASTTKIMTALLALENAELSDEVTFSSNAVNDIEDGGHHWEFEEGEVLTVNECLQFLLCESVNEAGYALAEHIDGSVSAFADHMNQRAAELGAVNTHFNNPHGLNDENHYTTARDMAMILWGCVQNDKFQQYASLQSVSLKGRKIRTEGFSTYTNHHLMLMTNSDYYDPDVVCGKTGYTSIAGNTLVTYARRGDMDVVCILMQGLSDRFDDTRKLLDYAFDNFELRDTASLRQHDIIGPALSLQETPLENSWVLLPKGADWSAVQSSFEPAGAPAAAGTAGVGAAGSASDGESYTDSRLGTRVWTYGDAVIQKEAVSFTLPETPAAEESEAESAEETQPAVETKEFIPEKEDGAPASVWEREYFGWQVREIAALFILAVAFIALFVGLIALIRVRAHRKRMRRRARYRSYDDEE